MWKNQKGFSLIEAIIIIGILAILSVSAVAMVGQIRYANTKKVVDEVDAALSALRIATMSEKEQLYLYIYELDDGYYMKQIEATQEVGLRRDGSGTRLCGKDVTFSGDSTLGTITGDNYICIVFKKNGVFRTKNDVIVAGSDEEYTNTNSITISGTDTYRIVLDHDTGRHYFELVYS